MELDMLRYFVNVALAESFVHGARSSHVTPPTVSKSIRRLEEELGCQLFERTTRSVALTPQGRVALEHAQRVLGDLEQLRSSMADPNREPQGPVRIGAMEVFSLTLLPTALTALVARYPGVVPHCHELIPSLMNEALVAGRLDVGLTIGAVHHDEIEVEKLGESEGALVCGREHPLYKAGTVSAEDLRHYPFVVPRFLGLEHLPCLDQFPDGEFQRVVGATIELLQTGVELARQGAFLGYFPTVSVQRDLNAGTLKALSGLETAEHFELFALRRRRRPSLPAVEALLKHIRCLL